MIWRRPKLLPDENFNDLSTQRESCEKRAFCFGDFGLRSPVRSENFSDENCCYLYYCSMRPLITLIIGLKLLLLQFFPLSENEAGLIPLENGQRDSQ